MERDTERTERERATQAWEGVGRDVAASLDGASAVVVVGDDENAAASVALGVGRVQAARRRVAIGDLIGDVAPLQALISGDDPHGLVDSFLYGVSLNKIARAAHGTRNLYILPSGTEPVVGEEIFRNDRWRRLAIGFGEVGALLLLVARANAPGVDALIGQLDGALLVDGATRLPDGVRVLAVAEVPAELARRAEDERVHEEEPALAAVGADEAADVPAAAAIAAIEPEVAPEIDAAEHAVEHRPDPIAVTADERAALARSAYDDVRAAAASRSDEEVAVPVAAESSASAAGAAVADDASATVNDDEPRDARWIRRVVAAPPTQVSLSAQPREPGERTSAPIADDALRPSRARWIVPAAAALVAIVGASALLTRGNDSGTRTEAGRRGARTTAPVAAATPADSPATRRDSLTATPATPAAPAAQSAVGGEVAAAPTATAATAATAAARSTPSSENAPPPVLAVANPADSARAATYAVQIVAANTLDGAKAKQRDVAWGLPAAVVSPMALASDNTRWFRLTVGAFPTRNAASAYALDLRKRRKLDLDPGNVVVVPYALLLEDKVPRVRVSTRVAVFNARGLPAYALVQPDGTARIYAGAFETPAQAALMASALAVADITPVVVYRTGRAL